MYTASQFGHADVLVAVLVAHGVDVNVPCNDGTTPVYRASKNGHSTAAKLLIAGQADLNVVTKWGTGLSIATSEGHTAVVELLRAAGAK